MRIPPLRTAERDDEQVVPRHWAAFLENSVIYEDGSGDDGLRVLDIAEPSAPTIVAELVPGWAIWGHTVQVEGDLLFYCSSIGLTIYDVTDPTNPVELDHEGGASAVDLVVADGLAYVGLGDQCLKIIDVSDPDAPVRLGGYDTAGSARAVAVQGNLAFVADYYDGARGR